MKAMLMGVLRVVFSRKLIKPILFLVVLGVFSAVIYVVVLQVKQGHSGGLPKSIQKLLGLADEDDLEPEDGDDDGEKGEGGDEEPEPADKGGGKEPEGDEPSVGPDGFPVGGDGDPVAAGSKMTFFEFENRLLSFLDTGNYDQALISFDNMPASVKEKANQVQLMELEEKLKKKIARNLRTKLEQATELRDELKFAQAAELIRPFQNLRFEDLAKEARDFLTTVEEYRGRKEARSHALVFSDVYERLREPLGARNYREAKTSILELTKVKRLAAAGDFLDACRDGIDAVTDLFEAAASRLKGAIGKSIYVAGRPAKLKGVNGMTLDLMVGTKEGSVRIPDLRCEDFQRVLGLKRAEADPDLVCAMAALYIHEGEFEKAKTWLVRVPESHVVAKKQRLFLRQMREIQALELIEKLRLAKKQVSDRRIQRYSQTLLKDHGDCDVVKAFRVWIEGKSGGDL